jgi:hypothetical protein
MTEVEVTQLKRAVESRHGCTAMFANRCRSKRHSMARRFGMASFTYSKSTVTLRLTKPLLGHPR